MPAYVPHPLPIAVNSPFTPWNIPFGIFSTKEDKTQRPGTAIGDFVLDLKALSHTSYFTALVRDQSVFNQTTLNRFSELPQKVRSCVRREIQHLITNSDSILYDQKVQPSLLLWREDVQMHLPMRIGGFTDYMCSLEHVSNVGRISGNGSIPENFFNIPLCHNGRASSVVISGTPIQRPFGLFLNEKGEPTFQPGQQFDYEAELGFFVSSQIQFGEMVPANRAEHYIFGFVILNDWSARDTQFYEARPLGPFNGKAVGTSISPWIVTLDALEDAGAFIRSTRTQIKRPISVANGLRCLFTDQQKI